MEKIANKIEKILKGRIITLFPPNKGNCPYCFSKLESFDIYKTRCSKCNKEITDFDYLEAIANELNFTLNVSTVKIKLNRTKKRMLKKMDKIREVSILKPNERIVKKTVIVNTDDLIKEFKKKYESDCANARACSETSCWLLAKDLCLNELDNKIDNIINFYF